MPWVVGRRDGKVLVAVHQLHHVQRHVRLLQHALDELVGQLVPDLEIARVRNNRNHVQRVFDFLVPQYRGFYISRHVYLL